MSAESSPEVVQTDENAAAESGEGIESERNRCGSDAQIQAQAGRDAAAAGLPGPIRQEIARGTSGCGLIGIGREPDENRRWPANSSRTPGAIG